MSQATYVDRFPKTAKVVKASWIVAFIALGIGGLFGLIQGLHRTGVFRGIVSSSQYYTVLTGHGTLLALVFTTFFIVGIFAWGIGKSLEREPLNMGLTWTWFWTMSVGTVLAVIAILGGFVPQSGISANVMFTFYPPLEAHPIFYVGLVLVIVGSWLAGYDWFRSYWDWKKENPDARIPLLTFMVLFTMLMWYLATIGVAVEVLFLVLPWSVGLVETIDPMLARTLFWYFGHPVVYFWLLPAYFVWYGLLPKLSGGRLFSDPLARVVFVLFLLFSTPVGYHHQYVDPGIPTEFKFLAMTNTMFLLLPSLLTAFTVVASMEHGGRQRGGTGTFGWLRALPWDSPAFVGCALAGIMFAAGGFSGMINAGMNIDYLVHNTIWIPGHFHLTVGTASALTFMAVTYWILPQLTGRPLKDKKMALAQPYTWFLGMTLMSNAMHRGGLAGIPRRTAEPTYQNFDFQAVFGSIGEIKLQIAAGGTILFISMLMFLWVIVRTWWADPVDDPLANQMDAHIPPALSGPEHSPAILDNMKVWFAIAFILVVIAYAIPLAQMVGDGIFFPGSPAFPT